MFKTILMYLAAMGILMALLVFKYDATVAVLSPVSGSETKVILQVTNKGNFDEFNTEIYSSSGKLVYFKRGSVARDIATVDASANRVVISDPNTKKTLKTVPLDFAASKWVKVFVDIDPSFDAASITAWGSMKGGWKALSLFHKIMAIVGTFILFFFVVLVPLGLISMVVSIVLDLTHGIYRPFTGSWINLLIGLGWLWVAWHFGLVDKVLHYPSPYAKAFFIAFLAGYPLYFLADRGFDGDERAADRASTNRSIWDGARNYTYTKTTWSDGRVTDDRMSSAMGSYLGTALWFLIFPIFLPFGTFWYLHTRWTLPILAGEFSWTYGEFLGGALSGGSAPVEENAPAPDGIEGVPADASQPGDVKDGEDKLQ